MTFGLSRLHAALLGAAMFSIASLPPPAVAVPSAVVALYFVVRWIDGRALRLEGAVAGSVGAAAMGLASDVTRIPPVSPAALGLWLGVPLVTGALVFIRLRGGRSLPVPALTIVLALVAIGAGVAVMVEHHGAETGVDVYFAHIEAAEALADGDDPYGEAVVTFDGRPEAPQGSVIEGYSYPPVTLFSYAAVQALFGDSRWLNLGAWAAVLAVVAVAAYRRRDEVSFVALLVASSFAAWRLMVYTAWTEGLTVLLVFVAGATWRRSRMGSMVALGLALGTKQYMVLLVPLIAFAAPWIGRVRAYGAMGVAAVSLVPSLILSGSTMLEALVFRFLRSGYRSDTLSLPRLVEALQEATTVLVLLGLVVVLAASWYAARRVEGFEGLMAGTVLVLGSFFLLTQALTNYWFLLAACCVLGVWSARTEEVAPDP